MVSSWIPPESVTATAACLGLRPVANALGGSEPGTSPEPIERLIAELGDDDYLVRQQAQEKLAELGFKACDALAVASTHEDLEIASRARFVTLKVLSVKVASKAPIVSEL